MASILIVDEDRTGRAILTNLLVQSQAPELSGIEILKASTEPEAIVLLSGRVPEVVMVSMADGERTLATCRALRRAQRETSWQLAVVGARRPGPALLARLRDEMAAQFFTKPFELENLVEFVVDSLARHGTATDVVPVKTRPAAGELADRRLPALLLDRVERRDTGVLRLSRGKIHKHIAVSSGHPVAVRSNARSETLGQFLRGQGVISPAHHAEAIRRAATSRRRIGEVLVELGALDNAGLLDALAAQIRFKLVRSLRWADGTWRFEPAPSIAAAGAPVDAVDLVFRGLKETARLSPLPPHLRAMRDTPLLLSERGRQLRPAWAPVFGESLAEATSGPITAEALLERGLGRDEVYGLLDALWLSDGLEIREAAPDALRGPEPSDSFSITELSARSQRARTEGPLLADVLFSDVITELDDSRPSTERADGEVTAKSQAPPRALLEAYLRIQGASHYEVVGAAPGASRDELETAIAAAEADAAQAGALGSETADQPLARAVRDALAAARATLLDDRARAAYDRGLDDRRETTAGGMDAEVSYERAREAMDREQWDVAVRELHRAVERAPDEATYRAELGWCHYLKGGRTPRAADQARPHLNQALSIDVDHPAAHEYKGVISAELGTDDVEALFHLKRALDADPERAGALDALEQLLAGRGEHRRLERHYRRMIQRVAGTHLELDLWLRMARLYRSQLDDPESAQIAFEAAAQLAPDDPEIEALIADLEAGRGGRFFADSAPHYQRWSAAPYDPEPGRRLLALASDAGMADHEFVAASCLVATGQADRRARELFARYRPRFVVRAQRQLLPELWSELTAGQDCPVIASLMELLAPAVHQLAPVTLDELEVSASDRVAEDALPAAFVDVRAYVGHMLGVAPPPVYVRGDLEQQIHVGGVTPPVLLVGSEIVSTPERLELAFRLGRAMTYLPPGRALGGSHPAGVLKRFVLGAWHRRHPELGEPAPELAPVIEAIARLPETSAAQIGELIDRLGASHPNLNLSEWRRALGRTADRVGLLLCGDIPAAVRFAADTAGSEAATELLSFACSPALCELRARVGLSIQV